METFAGAGAALIVVLQMIGTLTCKSLPVPASAPLANSRLLLDLTAVQPRSKSAFPCSRTACRCSCWHTSACRACQTRHYLQRCGTRVAQNTSL